MWELVSYLENSRVFDYDNLSHDVLNGVLSIELASGVCFVGDKIYDQNAESVSVVDFVLMINTPITSKTWKATYDDKLRMNSFTETTNRGDVASTKTQSDITII
jgi:hypothetical protein